MAPRRGLGRLESQEDGDTHGRHSCSREVHSVSSRFRCATLLATGSVCGIVGFSLACIIGVIKFFTENLNSRTGKPYASGWGYWPATVSEQVHDWNSPEGRIFFGFCLLAATLIFNSWYPYELRNVYTGRSKIGFLGWKVTYWITFRQIYPVMGLLLLICVSTVPTDSASGTEYFAVAVHLFGAFIMFVGYMVTELKCLGLCGFSEGKGWEYLDIEEGEFHLRRALMFFVLVFYMTFCGVQTVLYFASDDWLCCGDQYLDIHGKIYIYQEGFWNATAVNTAMRQLTDTASGLRLLMKVVSYMSEVVAGICVILSHLVIWYYCEERHVEYAAFGLAEVFDEEEKEETYDGDFHTLSDGAYRHR